MNKFILTLLIFVSSFSCTSNKDKVETGYVSRVDVEKIQKRNILYDVNNAAINDKKNIIYIVDGSKSMEGVCSGTTKIKGVIQSMGSFSNYIDAQTNVSLIVFDDTGINVKIPLCPFNKDSFLIELKRIRPGGQTPLGSAMSIAVDALLNQYKKQLGFGQYDLVVLTDGLASDARALENALISTYQYPFITLYGIGICIEGEHMIGQYALHYEKVEGFLQLDSALRKTIAWQGDSLLSLTRSSQ